MEQTILHAGCGSSPLPAWLGGHKEVRLDIDASVNPDIIASLTDLGDIGPFDKIWCCHCLEHLRPREVDKALSEFYRVLKWGGSLFAMVPDLEGVEPTTEILYESEGGPISGLDMLYGYTPWVEKNPFMAHKTGWIEKTFLKTLNSGHFRAARVQKLEVRNLLGVAVK